MAKLTQCRVCGSADGSFVRATFTGAPEGGVPVHYECLADFFRQIDDTPFPNRMGEQGSIFG